MSIAISLLKVVRSAMQEKEDDSVQLGLLQSQNGVDFGISEDDAKVWEDVRVSTSSCEAVAKRKGAMQMAFSGSREVRQRFLLAQF